MPHEQLIDGGITRALSSAVHGRARTRLQVPAGSCTAGVARTAPRSRRPAGMPPARGPVLSGLPTLKQGKKVAWDNITADGRTSSSRPSPTRSSRRRSRTR